VKAEDLIRLVEAVWAFSNIAFIAWCRRHWDDRDVWGDW